MSNLSDLDAILADAMASAAKTQTIQAARKKAVTARPGSDEFKEANEYVKKWEKEHHWKSVAYEALWMRENCSCCGRVNDIFQGLFEVRQHVHHGDRLEKQPATLAGMSQLPKRSAVLTATVRVCEKCIVEAGFPPVGE